jgi:hypothetical protein
MKVFTVSLIIFFFVLAVSLLVGFSDLGGVKKNTPALNASPSNAYDEQPQDMPSGLRILVKPTD